MTEPSPSPDGRVLLRAATARDAFITTDVLRRAGVAVCVCDDLRRLIDELAVGASALVLAEEVILDPSLPQLHDVLASQPPWSDVPVIVLARQGADSRALGSLMGQLSNVTVIERPVRISSFISATQSALRARSRQYQTRALLSELREADQRKTEFLATLAHELRNPLAPINASLALVRRNKLPADDQNRHFAMMKRQIDHMVRLIDDLMEVSRITRNKVDINFAVLSLAEVIADAVELSRPRIVAERHALRLELGAAPLHVRADRVRLTQVFSNLLNNAAKYTPSGGVVTVRQRQDGASAVVEVIDTGIGLAPDSLESIFDMFVQVGGASRFAQGGLGIGLTLVKSLVERHGGTVTASSGGLDAGSTFVVTLPLAADADPLTVPPDRDGDRHALSLAGMRILVVDDNRDAADALGELLTALGAQVLTAYGGEEALRHREGPEFDAAVLDIGMPGLDGCAVARALRDAQSARPMTLVALTGWGQPEDRERIVAAGFDHHLVKPVEIDRLVRLLRPALASGA